jgi:hypothetical protein
LVSIGQAVARHSKSRIRIAQYVVEQSESLEAGIKFIDVIEDKCKTYSQFPEAGIPRDDLGKGEAADRSTKYWFLRPCSLRLIAKKCERPESPFSGAFWPLLTIVGH